MPQGPSPRLSRGGLTASPLGGLCWRDYRLRGEAMPSRNIDPALLPAQVMSDEIGAGRLSPVDLVEGALKRIEVADEKLHAVVEVFDIDARLASEAAVRATHA